MAICFNVLLLLCTCLVSASKGPVLWNQPENNQPSNWNDQVNSPSNNWYRNDEPILAQSEIIMPDYIRKQSGFALYPVSQQEQASFGTKLKPQKQILPENYNRQSKKPFGIDGKQQRRYDFPANKVPPRKWNIGPPYPPVNYYNLKNKQQAHPNEVLKVKSLTPQNFRQVFKTEETPNSIKNALNGNKLYKPSVHREYALSAISSPKLNQFSPQNQGYIVSAPSRVSTTTPVDFTTNKSPIFFVTDGYRNVLHQGTNEAQTNNPDIQTKQESKTVELENAPNAVKIIDGGQTEADRDDSLHEPSDDTDKEKIQNDDRIENDEDNESDDEEVDAPDTKKSQSEFSEEETSRSDEENEREDSREPDNEHADPKPIPTKPIYPGEGVWARQRIRHRPHITQHRFIQPQTEYQQKPDGYDVFSNLEQYFNKQKDNVGQNFERIPKNAQIHAQPQIRAPNSVVPLVIYDPFQEFQQLQNRRPLPYVQQSYIQQPSYRPIHNNVVQTSPSQSSAVPYRAQPAQQESSEEAEEEFVPQRLYAQVRNSENEQHLPQDPAEGPRLKEVIKDSKVHTLYSEEGYEDSAYDHAGHEKKAEQDEGKAKYEKEKLDSKKKKTVNEKPDDNHEGQSVKVIVTESPKPESENSSQLENDYPKNNKKFSSNKMNNYITTPEIKTAHIKDKNNGDVQLEIESQVQVIMQPNNSTKAHKYVRIYPKVPDDLSDKSDDETELHVIEQINEMTLKQFSVNDEAADTNENAAKERRKRSSERWFEDVNIDMEFIDKINHTFEPPKKEVVDAKKFPYYKSKDINKDSPLRYAENPNNVPVKKAGELSFYKAADKHACPEIIQNIDPVPDHIKNAKESDDYDEEDDEEDDADGEGSQIDERIDGDESVTPKGPKIELGDKIDCLKARYFGENPLDNPFFKEAFVEPVEPLFKDLANNFKIPNKKPVSEKKTTEIRKKDETEKKNMDKSENIQDYSEEKPEDHQVAASFIINAEIEPVPNIDNSISSQENDKPVSSALVSLITTPKYTIELVPNNIYDQIKLLEHLPEQAKAEEPADKTNTTANEIEPESTTVEPKKESQPTEEIEEINPTTTKQESNGNRQSKGLDLDEETKSEGPSEDGDIINEPQALRRLRKRPRRPMYEIFDINKFLTTTPFSLIDSDPTTVLPKYKVISEVFYKDEIKPNEQLNVFADVLNNIKNSSHIDLIPIESPSHFPEADISASGVEEYDTVPQIKKSSNVRVKKFQSDSSNYNNKVEEEGLTDYEPEGNMFQESYVEKRHRQVSKNRKSNSGEEVTTKKAPKYRSRRPRTTTTTLRTTTATEESTPSNHRHYVIDHLEDTEQVIGLVPPESWQYKTIVVDDVEAQSSDDVTERVKMPNDKIKPTKSQKPAPVTELNDEVPPDVAINLFPVIGMKPPSKERAHAYFEYLINNNNNKKVRRRVSNGSRRHLRRTRDASRPSYSEVSRSRGRQVPEVEQTTLAQEDDDYVPHRPTNYHYDEKTGKIVYHSKPKEENSEEIEEEVEEIEIPVMPGIYLERAEDATHPTPKKTTISPLLVTATPPPDGQGLLDFVVLLKNNPSYKYIPDPMTPKPGAVTTTEAFATVDPKSTNPPEFLSILSKVRNDDRYKLIEDPKEAKSKPKTTTAAPPEEEDEVEAEEEEEGTIENVIVQPGIDLSNVQIFNVGDFLPKIQTPISSDIKTSFVKKYVVDKLFPKLRYMNVFDVVKDYLSQSAPVKYIKSKMHIPDEKTGKLNNIDIFDINAFIPPVKPIVTSKPIDYSKYKTIERPRNNLSSRYNADDQTNLDDVVTVRRPLFEEVQRAEQPRITKTDDVDEEVTTTQKIVQSRRRSRPRGQSRTKSKSVDGSESPTTLRSSSRRRSKPASTKRPTTLITEASEIADIYTPTERMTAATNPKPKRVYRRRPIRIRPTTEHVIEDGEYAEHLVRRSVDDDDVSDDNLDINSSHYIIITQDLLNELFKNHVPAEFVDLGENRDESRLLVSDESDGNRPIDANRYVNDNHNQASDYPYQAPGINIAQELIQEVDGLVSQRENYTGGKISAKYNTNKDKRRRRKKGRRKKNRKGAKKYINNLDDVQIIDENYDRSKKHGGNYRAQIEFSPENIYQESSDDTDKHITRNKYSAVVSDARTIQRVSADKPSAKHNILSSDTDDRNINNYNILKNHTQNVQNPYSKTIDNNSEGIDEGNKDLPWKKTNTQLTSSKTGQNIAYSSVQQSDNSDIQTSESYQEDKLNLVPETIEKDASETGEQIEAEEDANVDEPTEVNRDFIKQTTYKPILNYQNFKNDYGKKLNTNEDFKLQSKVSTDYKSESSLLLNKNVDTIPDVEVNNNNYDINQKHRENIKSNQYFSNIDKSESRNTHKDLLSLNSRDKSNIQTSNKNYDKKQKQSKFSNSQDLVTPNRQKTSNFHVMNKNYDKKENHGGNLKPEEDFAYIKQPQFRKSQTDLLTPNKYDTSDVQIMNKNYNKKEQHGGNFKFDEDFSNTRETQRDRTSPNKQDKSDIQVMNKNYNKKQLHGGNLKSEEYFGKDKNTQEDTVLSNRHGKSDVQVMNKNYDKNHKHGPNFKSAQHFTITEQPEPKKGHQDLESLKSWDISDVQVVNKNYDKKELHKADITPEGSFGNTDHSDLRNTQEYFESPNSQDITDVEVESKTYDKKEQPEGNLKTDEYFSFIENQHHRGDHIQEDSTLSNREYISALRGMGKSYGEKHDGNVKSEYVNNTSEPKVATKQDDLIPLNSQDISDVQIVNTNYDKLQKHGGNLKSDDDLNLKSDDDANIGDLEPTKSKTISPTKQDISDVQIINQNYDKKQKHGGNYKFKDYFDNVEQPDTSQEDLVPQSKQDITDVQVMNKNFDKQQKHGGNLKSDEDILSSEEQETKKSSEDLESPNNQAMSDVQIMNKNYDKKHEHGGNLKSDEDTDVILEEPEQVKDLEPQNTQNGLSNPETVKDENSRDKYEFNISSKNYDSINDEESFISEKDEKTYKLFGNNKKNEDYQYPSRNSNAPHQYNKAIHTINLENNKNTPLNVDSSTSKPILYHKNEHFLNMKPNLQRKKLIKIIKKKKIPDNGKEISGKDIIYNNKNVVITENPLHKENHNINYYRTTNENISTINNLEKGMTDNNGVLTQGFKNNEMYYIKFPYTTVSNDWHNEENIGNVQQVSNEDAIHNNNKHMVITERTTDKENSDISFPHITVNGNVDTERIVENEEQSSEQDITDNNNKHIVVNESLPNKEQYNIDSLSGTVSEDLYSDRILENEEEESEEDLIDNNDNDSFIKERSFNKDKYKTEFPYETTSEGINNRRTVESEEKASEKNINDNNNTHVIMTLNMENYNIDLPYSTINKNVYRDKTAEHAEKVSQKDIIDNNYNPTIEIDTSPIEENHNIDSSYSTVAEDSYREKTVQNTGISENNVTDNNQEVPTDSLPIKENSNVDFPYSENLYSQRTGDNEEPIPEKGKEDNITDNNQGVSTENIPIKENSNLDFPYSENIYNERTGENEEPVPEKEKANNITDNNQEVSTVRVPIKENSNVGFLYRENLYNSQRTGENEVLVSEKGKANNITDNNQEVPTASVPIKENSNVGFPYRENLYSQRTGDNEEPVPENGKESNITGHNQGVSTESVPIKEHSNLDFPYSENLYSSQRTGENEELVSKKGKENNVTDNNQGVLTGSVSIKENSNVEFPYRENMYSQRTGDNEEPVPESGKENNVTDNNQGVLTESVPIKQNSNVDFRYSENQYSQRTGESKESDPEKDVIDNINHIVVTESSPNNESYYIDYPYRAVGEDVHTERTVKEYHNSEEPMRIQIDIANADPDLPDNFFEDRKDDNRIVPKLADVVLKPEYFFTDPTLPVQVNKLNEDTVETAVDSDDLKRAIEEGDLIKTDDETPKNDNRRVDEEHKSENKKAGRQSLDEENQNNLKDTTGSSTTQKSPIIIKDPSKRLYFYAAV